MIIDEIRELVNKQPEMASMITTYKSREIDEEITFLKNGKINFIISREIKGGK